MSQQLPDLNNLERWMKAVITNPAGVSEGLASEAARECIDISSDEVERVVTRSRSLTATGRLSIYSNAYFMRLQECLRAEFPVLLHALGEELFVLFTLEYLKNYPSRSYTLNRLGENFPRYLAESRPDAGAPDSERESWPDFIVDLATLERTFAEVFDGPGSEGLTLPGSDFVLQIMPENLRLARLTAVPCFRLLSFRYPAIQYFNAARKQENPPLPEPATTYVAMNRRDYTVHLHELTAPQYELLSALTTGSTLAQLADGHADAAAFVAQARSWVISWADKGFFSAIEAGLHKQSA